MNPPHIAAGALLLASLALFAWAVVNARLRPSQTVSSDEGEES